MCRQIFKVPSFIRNYRSRKHSQSSNGGIPPTTNSTIVIGMTPVIAVFPIAVNLLLPAAPSASEMKDAIIGPIAMKSITSMMNPDITVTTLAGISKRIGTATIIGKTMIPTEIAAATTTIPSIRRQNTITMRNQLPITTQDRISKDGARS